MPIRLLLEGIQGTQELMGRGLNNPARGLLPDLFLAQ